MKRLFISLTILTLLVVPQFALGSDVDDLKAAVERFVQAFNSLDAGTVAEMAHPGLVVYNNVSPFPFVYSNTAAFEEDIQDYFSGLESLNYDLYNPQYMVVGNTGVMWGHETGTANTKEGLEDIVYFRVTMTFIKSDGNWRVLTIHLSELPSGD